MKKITITVEGGVIQDIKGIPVGVEVEVIDFDAEGAENYELVDGEPAIVSTYRSEQFKMVDGQPAIIINKGEKNV